MKPFQIFITIILSALAIATTSEKYSCGEKEKVNRPYGIVELRVDCTVIKGDMWVAEFKGKELYGASQGFDIATGRRKDSLFYINGKEEGIALSWDSLGNISSRANYHKGKYVGKLESFFSPGHPALIKNYNSAGKEEGSWLEWWAPDIKKAEYFAKNGEIISATEYYLNGNLRAKYKSKYDPQNTDALRIKYIDCESWAPNGKSAGRIQNGKGQWLVFPDGHDPTNTAVFRETYNDSMLTKLDTLTEKEISVWMKQ